MSTATQDASDAKNALNNGSKVEEDVPAEEDGPVTVQSAIDFARRAFALKKYEEAVDCYATALELATKEHGGDPLAPELADLYFAYGKALLENAITQSAVLGKEEDPDADENADVGPSGKNAFLSFSGDGDDLAPADGDEDPAVDLFAEARKAVDAANAPGSLLAGINMDSQRDDDDDDEEDDGEGGGEEDGEPEDDFNAAWEVLDLARTIYDKRQDEDDETKLKLADTYIALGDISLETEKFDQAITDYTSGIGLKETLLPQSSRQIAEVHYKLSMVLDLTSGRLSDAIAHAGLALASVDARLTELRGWVDGQSGVVVPEAEKVDLKGKGKGKAKATGAKLCRDELVQNMSRGQVDTEIKELEGLKEDLALKVEELKTTPVERSTISAPALVAKALDADLNGLPSSSGSGAGLATTESKPVVNDLTGVVKKKAKRKAEEAPAVEEGSESTKKAKLE